MAFGGSDPANNIVGPYTKANSDIPSGTCRSILIGTAGTLNGTDSRGVAFVALPVQAGYNPIRLKQISTGGTADNIWLLY